MNNGRKYDVDQNYDFQFYIRENIVFCVVCMLSTLRKVLIYTVKQAAEMRQNNATTLMTPSGMVRGVRGRTSAVTEEDRGSVSSCLNPTQDDIEMRVCSINKHFVEDVHVVLEQIELYVQ